MGMSFMNGQFHGRTALLLFRARRWEIIMNNAINISKYPIF